MTNSQIDLDTATANDLERDDRLKVLSLAASIAWLAGYDLVTEVIHELMDDIEGDEHEPPLHEEDA